jgi:hypothetical protein
MMVAVSWIDNRAVTFISTSVSTKITEVKRHVGADRMNIPAPEIVSNYNKYMGGVD